MAILEQLQIDYTFFFQFAIFVLTLLGLSQISFAPYFKAYEERENRTKGGEDLAQETRAKAAELKAQYETKARQVSGDIKTIYDTYRDGASKEYESIVSKARAESSRLIDEARAKVTVEVSEASKRLKDEVPQIVQAITKKLLVK